MLAENFTKIFDIFLKNSYTACGDYSGMSGNLSLAFDRDSMNGTACLGNIKCVSGSTETFHRQFSSLFMAAGALHDGLERCILYFNREEYLHSNYDEDKAYLSGFMGGLATATMVFASCCALKKLYFCCRRMRARAAYVPLGNDQDVENLVRPSSTIEEPGEEEILVLSRRR